MLVRCVLTVEGVIKDCLPDQDVPELAPMIRQLEQRRYRPALRDGLMNENVKFTLEQRRYAPAVVEGVPTAVDFIFRMTLALE
jgi:hypothetical protein